MLTLIQKEIGNLPKMTLLSVWLILLGVMTVITSIIVLGLGTNNQLTEIIIQNQIAFNDHGNAWAGWPVATSLFGSLFTQVTFLFFEAYLISVIIIEAVRQQSSNQLSSHAIRNMKLLWCKILIVVSLSFVAQVVAAIIVQLLIKLIAIETGSSYSLTVTSFIHLLVITVGTVLVGLLPLVFGMIRYSTIMTMLSSVILSGILSNAFPGTLSNSLMNSLPCLLVGSIMSLSCVSICVFTSVKKVTNTQ